MTGPIEAPAVEKSRTGRALSRDWPYSVDHQSGNQDLIPWKTGTEELYENFEIYYEE